MAELLIEEDLSKPSGHARLVVRGAALPADPGFRMRRIDQSTWLGLDGWQAAPYLIEPDAARAEGDDFVLEVGPGVVNRLLSDLQIEVEVPAANLLLTQFWPDIPPWVGDLGNLPPLRPAKVPFELPAVQVAEPASPDPAPIVVPGLQSQEKEKKEEPRRRPWRLLAALVALLIVAGGTGWWAWRQGWFRGGEQYQAVAQPPPAPPTPPPPAPALQPAASFPAQLAALRAKQPRDPQALLSLARAALAGGDADTAVAAVEDAIDLKSGAGLRQMGQWHDPSLAGGRPSPFRNPNPGAAVDYYHRAKEAGEVAVGDDLARLCKHLQDANANDSLKSCACGP